MRTRPFATALAVLALPVALAACSADPEPILADPATPVETTEAPSTPGASNPPQRPTTPEDVVVAWHRGIDRMQLTGKTGAFRRLGPNCATCNAVADEIRAIYLDGGSMTARPTEVLRVRETAEARASLTMESDVVSQPSTINYADGRVERFKGGRETYRFNLFRTGGTWYVTSYTRVVG